MSGQASEASPDVAIEVDGVGKRYTKYDDTPMLVSSLLHLRNRTRRSKIWALRGATFTIGRGEVVGVIGRNGSGKSTLLQMLAGVTAPTEGRVAVRGRVAPLISVGVGFHPELTGRENVYVNGSILGLKRHEIDARFDEIVEFSEIGDFIDTPVKFYSSGMFVRLGFAVSVLAQPDVLLVDEVLAVGDMAFQMKCFERMEQLRSSGATIVIVTHNLNAVRRLCDRTIVIHDGELRHDGDTVEAMSLYHDLLGQPTSIDDSIVTDGKMLVHAADLESVDLLSPEGQSTRHVEGGSRVTAEATVRFHQALSEPLFGLVVVSENGMQVYGERWQLRNASGGRDFRAGDTLQVRVAFDAELAIGSYSVQLGVATLKEQRVAGVPPPILFFVSGRDRVRGVADLHGVLATEAAASSGSQPASTPERVSHPARHESQTP